MTDIAEIKKMLMSITKKEEKKEEELEDLIWVALTAKNQMIT